MNSELLSIYLIPGLAMIVVLLVFVCNALTLVYDYKIVDRGIQFVLFRRISVGLIAFEDIVEVRTARPWQSILSAVNFTNRFRYALKPILIRKRTGVLSKEVLLTPRNPESFLAIVKSKVAK